MTRAETPDVPLRFKIATEDWEFEAIHRLSYETFVEEIPQHARNAERRQVDKFHSENTYAICLRGDRLVGMVAGRSKRPFSLDAKVPDLDAHLPPGHHPVEVRLLAVDRQFRGGFVFAQLVGLIARHFRDQGGDLAVVSATTRQLRLYRHLGCVAFGPLVGTGEALFQPMYLTLDKFLERGRALAPPKDAGDSRPAVACYLPGPVGLHAEVCRAFESRPVSHRSESFLADFRATQRMLRALTRTQGVEILLGSGSLANDAVAAQLTLLCQQEPGPGLILTNGEFGERLVDHATRQGLEFEVQRSDWGDPLDYAEVRRRLDQPPGRAPRWLWATHCETSTGVLNDLGELQRLCAERNVKLCLDGISSLGTVPVDWSGVYLASAASGKALASYPGLSLVFHNHTLEPAPTALPRYLDLGYYAAQAGVPFTHSSNLVVALETALSRVDWPQKFARITRAGTSLRRRLRQLGFQVVAPEAHASPAVTTVALPRDVSSKKMGDALERAGCLLSYNSGYLLARNWIQICLLGEWSEEHLDGLPDQLAALRADRDAAR